MLNLPGITQLSIAVCKSSGLVCRVIYWAYLLTGFFLYLFAVEPSTGKKLAGLNSVMTATENNPNTN